MGLGQDLRPQPPRVPSPSAQPFPGILLPQATPDLTQRLPPHLPIFYFFLCRFSNTTHNFRVIEVWLALSRPSDYKCSSLPPGTVV